MKISIIIPVYNEAQTVAEIINRVRNLDLDKEIIVVDDGSIDGGYEVCQKIEEIILLRHKINKGKGAAVRTALSCVTGDIVIIQDADLELNPEQIPYLINPIKYGKSEVVYGSRNLYKRKDKLTLFYIGGLFVTWLTNFLYKTQLSDEPCGFKAFRAKLIKNITIKSDRFEFEPEITAKIAKMGITILEVPVHATSRTKEQGKKLGSIDGLKAIWTLIKYKFCN